MYVWRHSQRTKKRIAAMMMIWSDKRRCVVSLYSGVCATISFSHFLVLRRSYQIFKTARTQCTVLWSGMKIVFHSARPFFLSPIANVIVLDMLWHSEDDCQWQMEWHNMHKRKTFNRLSYKVKSTWRRRCWARCCAFVIRDLMSFDNFIKINEQFGWKWFDA